MYQKVQYYNLFFFLIYINDLLEGSKLDLKLFADDTSLFSAVKFVNTTASTLNNDFPTVEETPVQEHLDINFDNKLLFTEHINDTVGKTMKYIGLLCKF